MKMNKIEGTELQFNTHWEAMLWMREELWKRGLEINPLSEDFSDPNKVWLRYAERPTAVTPKGID